MLGASGFGYHPVVSGPGLIIVGSGPAAVAVGRLRDLVTGAGVRHVGGVAVDAK